MTRTIKKLAILGCMIGCALPGQLRAEPITALPAADLAWERTPEGVAFAPLIGNRFAGPYMAMVQLPAGLVSPPHVKSADMFGVMVSGAMIHVPAGTDPSDGARLFSGAFYRIPAGVPHVSSCVSDEDCVTSLYQDGKFDFLPVQ
jgi:uncharacterized RmlC-like cupin family protein